jgi:DNA-binding MarR family transcriptional regulator
MPIPSSPIAYEIIYLVTARAETHPVSVKDLYLDLDYSEARVSEVLRHLVEDGWIVSRRSSLDGRIRQLYPSDKANYLLVTISADV